MKNFSLKNFRKCLCIKSAFFLAPMPFFLMSSLLIFFSCKNHSSLENKKSVLRMNISSEPDSLNPWRSASADSEALWRNIFEGLMAADQQGKIFPCLAESVEQSEDGFVYKFILKKGILFHNKKEFTSLDAEWTYKNLAGLEGFLPVSAKFSSIKSVRSNGPYEFIVELKEADPAFLIAATAPILPAHYEEHDARPVGTGPYEFCERVQNQKIVFEKNANYWNLERVPQIEKIEVLVVTDEAASIAALRSGDLDVATMVSAENARALENEFQVLSFPQNMAQILGMNNSRLPFRDIRVRKAIAMAVNKKQIVDGVFSGEAEIIHSNFSPVLKEFFAENLESENPFDPKKAAALLEEAGYENGFDVVITVPANYQPHVDTAQIVAENLAEIGVRSSINAIEWASWLDVVYTKFDYDMTIIGFAGKLSAADILRRYHSPYAKNFTRFFDEDFDKNFEAAARERDRKKQIEFYKECQKILAQRSPAVFICDPAQIYLAQKNVRGIAGAPFLFHDFAAWRFE